MAKKDKKVVDNTDHQKTQKQFLVPETQWQSTDILEVRGDILQVLESQMVTAYKKISEALSEFQKAGQALSYLMQYNIKSGKIALNYKWNNGEPATAEEVESYKSQMEQLQKHQQEKQQHEKDFNKKFENASKTGLVDEKGAAIATTQDLDEVNIDRLD